MSEEKKRKKPRNAKETSPSLRDRVNQSAEKVNIVHLRKSAEGNKDKVVVKAKE